MCLLSDRCLNSRPSSYPFLRFASLISASDPFLDPNTIHNESNLFGWKLTRRALLPNTLPLTILGAVFLVIVIFLNFGKLISAALGAFQDDDEDEEGLDAEDNPTWTKTLEDNKLNREQVFSYEVTKNPMYRHCFELTVDGAAEDVDLESGEGDPEGGRLSGIDTRKRTQTAEKLVQRFNFSESFRLRQCETLEGAQVGEVEFNVKVIEQKEKEVQEDKGEEVQKKEIEENVEKVVEEKVVEEKVVEEKIVVKEKEKTKEETL